MSVKTLKDYIDPIQERFPFLTKDEISKILEYGLIKYVWVNRMHADVLFKNTTDEPLVMFSGRLSASHYQHFLNWVSKWRMKERVLFYLKNKTWDGYYYIGLTDEQHKKIKPKGKHYAVFTNCYFTKLENELHHLKWVKHIWRVPFLEDCGWKFYVEKFKTDKAEYIGENDYEKYHQCFLGRFNHGYAPDVDTSELSERCAQRIDVNLRRERLDTAKRQGKHTHTRLVLG